MTLPCPACGEMRSEFALNMHGYRAVRCLGCGALYLDPLPSEESAQAAYRQADYFEGSRREGYQNYEEMRKVILPHAYRRLRQISHQFPKPGRLLDFGCAAGYFLEAAQSLGWRVAGVEISPGMAERAAHRLRAPVVTSIDSLPEKEFEVITLWEVIEHLHHPLAVMQRLRKLLVPGGLLMLSTPNAAHWQVNREPQNWTGFRSIPLHVVFFTDLSLVTLLERAGFQRVTIFKTAPLPTLPHWLRRLSAPLEQSLSIGQARPWPVALLVWRVIRVLGWAWQKATRPDDDIFATLEAMAFRPQLVRPRPRSAT